MSSSRFLSLSDAQWERIEPLLPSNAGRRGHPFGTTRGGLTTKIHAAVDGRGRSLAAVVTGGQRNDGAMLIGVLADICVPRLATGRPRTSPSKGAA